ncbi:hypothetical protein FN846DRAFT_885595 [Sphaerosporella brunnea]|uniref:Uncharacterized protein n=1 Tax=Sphaerosporella brunnea TaxID=1250544 RepID=A0A5J5FC57_9PEZI|nr:hypothetical protein FN846DRAFT_885595 [Sphaerosporella brunnea]
MSTAFMPSHTSSSHCSPLSLHCTNEAPMNSKSSCETAGAEPAPQRIRLAIGKTSVEEAGEEGKDALRPQRRLSRTLGNGQRVHKRPAATRKTKPRVIIKFSSTTNTTFAATASSSSSDGSDDDNSSTPATSAVPDNEEEVLTPFEEAFFCKQRAKHEADLKIMSAAEWDEALKLAIPQADRLFHIFLGVEKEYQAERHRENEIAMGLRRSRRNRRTGKKYGSL